MIRQAGRHLTRLATRTIIVIARVGRIMRPGARRAGLVTVAAAGLVLAAASAAVAHVAAPAPSPSPEPVKTISLEGHGIDEPLVVAAATAPELYAAVVDQVSWLTGKGQFPEPDAEVLGPKYTVTLLTDDKAEQTFDLYPLAEGGPRAFRPANQPDGRKLGAAWFYGRLTMSETLRAAGAPLPERPDTVHGGIGGGERVIPDDLLGSDEDVNRWFGELRQLLLLNGAVLVTITAGLAGIALLVRRRTR
jgi:hypothetical protein